jgi:hypothetical protein
VSLLENRRRRRRARDLERRLRELDRLDQQYGLGAMPSAGPARPRKRGRGLVAVLGLAVVAMVVYPGLAPEPVREVVAQDGGSSRQDVVFDWLPDLDLPGFGPRERLRPPPEQRSDSTAYEFLETQEGQDEPVTYDPCQEIEVAINPEGAPGDHEHLVRTSLEHTSAVTGFSFRLVGTTDDRRTEVRSALEPVLVLWATEDEVPELAGRVAGIGGSTVVQGPGGHRELVSGAVVLDIDAYAEMDDPQSRQAVVDHEFGHVVGLGHVDDPAQLMNRENAGVVGYGDGDLAGFARLGNVPCG